MSKNNEKSETEKTLEWVASHKFQQMGNEVLITCPTEDDAENLMLAFKKFLPAFAALHDLGFLTKEDMLG